MSSPAKSSPSDAPDSGKGLAEHSLRGEIEKVLFESEDGTYSVLQVRDAQGKTHSVVGSMQGAYAGQWIGVSGRWDMHKEHGRQLRANSYSYSLPATLDGIKKYLASGVIHGIGEKYADAIVGHFGLKTLEVLDNYSASLKEVPGIGRSRIKSIQKAWRENAERRNLQMHLQSLGLTQGCIARVYRRYGDESAKVIGENPYRLAHEVDGIGFLTADRIAANMGIGKGDMKRLVAGVAYTLAQMRLAGHVCMPEEDFIKVAAETLDVGDAEAREGLRGAVEGGVAVEELSGSGVKMVYDPPLLKLESELPELLASLCRAKSHKGRAMLKVASSPDAKFSDEQIAAVERAGSNPVSIITGGPGVGKTTVVGEIVRRCRAAKLRIFLAAPTGRAAKRMSEATGIAAATIHRMLKWDPVKRRFVYGRGCPLPCDVLVVDEVSMLDIGLATWLLRALRHASTLILVGDADQLPSVGPGNVLNDIIASGLVQVSRLTKIFRQGDGSGIIRAAHAVNEGRIPDNGRETHGEELSDFYWIERDDPEDVASLMEHLIVERIPKRFGLDPISDIQALCPMNRGICGTVAMNTRIQSALNGGESEAFRCGERLYKVGDKVMQTSNNYDKGVFNGDMGRIAWVRHGDSLFGVRFDSGMVEYGLQDAEQLTLAYAVTVHKSQGSEFPALVMPLLTQHYMMLQRNLLYTGMTRAKRLMILIGSRKAVSMAVRNAVRDPRHTLLQQRLSKAFMRTCGL